MVERDFAYMTIGTCSNFVQVASVCPQGVYNVRSWSVVELGPRVLVDLYSRPLSTQLRGTMVTLPIGPQRLRHTLLLNVMTRRNPPMRVDATTYLYYDGAAWGAYGCSPLRPRRLHLLAICGLLRTGYLVGVSLRLRLTYYGYGAQVGPSFYRLGGDLDTTCGGHVPIGVLVQLRYRRAVLCLNVRGSLYLSYCVRLGDGILTCVTRVELRGRSLCL